VLVLLAVAVLSVRCGKNPNAPDTPQFGFNWNGLYSVQACVDSGDAAGACAQAPVGQTAPYTLSLTQTGTTVSGSSTLGNAVFPTTSGTIANDGSLQLKSTLANGPLTQTLTWTLTISGTQLQGTFTAVATDAGGAATLTGKITTAVHP
jgi:hypothetical protein